MFSSIEDLTTNILNQLAGVLSEQNLISNTNNNKSKNNNQTAETTRENNNNKYSSTTIALNRSDSNAIVALQKWTDDSIQQFTQFSTLAAKKQLLKMMKNRNNKSTKNSSDEEIKTNNKKSFSPAAIAAACSTIRLELFKIHSATSYRLAVQIAVGHTITAWMEGELRLYWKLFLKREIGKTSNTKAKTKNQGRLQLHHQSLNLAITTCLSDFNQWFTRVVSAGSSIFNLAVVESVFEAKRIILSECISKWVRDVSIVGEEDDDVLWKNVLSAPLATFLGSSSSSRSNNSSHHQNHHLSVFSSQRELAEDVCHKFGAAAEMNNWICSIQKVIDQKLTPATTENNTKTTNLIKPSIIFGVPLITTSSSSTATNLFSILCQLLSLRPNPTHEKQTAQTRPLICDDWYTFALRSQLSALIAACDSTLLFGTQQQLSLSPSSSSFFTPTTQQILNNSTMASLSSGFVAKTLRTILLANSPNIIMELINTITNRIAMNMMNYQTPPASPVSSKAEASMTSPTNKNNNLSAQQQKKRQQLNVATRFMLDYESLQKQLLREIDQVLEKETSLSFCPGPVRLRSSIWKMVALLSSIQYNHHNNNNTTASSTSFAPLRSLFKNENFSAALLGVDPSESHHHTSRPEHGAALSPSSSLDTMVPGEHDISLAVFRISSALSTIPTGTINAIDVLRRMLVRRQRVGSYSSSSSSNTSSSSSLLISCAQLDSANADVDQGDSSGKGSGIGGDNVPIALSTPLHRSGRLLDWVVVQVPSKTTTNAVLDVLGSVVPLFTDSRPALLRQAVSLLVSPALPTEKLADYLSTMVMMSSSSSSRSRNSSSSSSSSSTCALRHGEARGFALHIITSAAQSYSLTRLKRAIEPLILKVGFQFSLLTPEFAEVIKQYSIFGSSNSNTTTSGSKNHLRHKNSSEAAISKISAENLILALERRVSDVKPVDRDFGASLLRCARQALTHQATILKMLRIAGTTFTKHQQQMIKKQQQQSRSLLFSTNKKSINNDNNNSIFSNFNLQQHQKLIDAFTRRSQEVCLRLFRCIANRFEDILVSSEAMMMLASLQQLDLTTAAEVSGVSPNGLPATVKSISHSILGSAASQQQQQQKNEGDDETEDIGDNNVKSGGLLDDRNKTKKINNASSSSIDWNQIDFSVKSLATYNNNSNNYHSNNDQNGKVSCNIQINVSKSALFKNEDHFGFDDDDDDEEAMMNKYKQLVTIEVWSPREKATQQQKKGENNNNNNRSLLESYTTLLDLKPILVSASSASSRVLSQNIPTSPTSPMMIHHHHSRQEIGKSSSSSSSTTTTTVITFACNNLQLPQSLQSVSPFGPYQDCLDPASSSVVSEFLESQQQKGLSGEAASSSEERKRTSSGEGGNVKFLGGDNKKKEDQKNQTKKDDTDEDQEEKDERRVQQKKDDREEKQTTDSQENNNNESDNEDDDRSNQDSENENEHEDNNSNNTNSIINNTNTPSCDAPLVVIRLAHQQLSSKSEVIGVIPKPIRVLPLSVSGALSWCSQQEEESNTNKKVADAILKKLREVKSSSEEEGEMQSNEVEEPSSPLSYEEQLMENLKKQKEEEEEEETRRKNQQHQNHKNKDSSSSNLAHHSILESAVVIPITVDESDFFNYEDDDDDDEQDITEELIHQTMDKKRKAKMDQIRKFLDNLEQIIDGDDNTSSCFLFWSRARFPRILVGAKVEEGKDDDFIVIRLFCSSLETDSGVVVSDDELLLMNSLDCVECALVEEFN